MKYRALLLGALLGAASPARADSSAPAPPASLRVCLYYDAGKSPGYKNGLLHAIMLENLLGHFREAQTRLLPVDAYQRGSLDHCDRAAYVASYYDAPVPQDFLSDVAADHKPFLWINYNIRQLQDEMGGRAFTEKSGFMFDDVAGFDLAASTAGVPGFYRDFDYKGQHFFKMALRKADGALVAAPDIGVLRNVSARVLSTATHSSSGKTTPYATEKNGFFYVADNPFLFIHEQDRYLIVADLLFDFMDLPPRSPKRYALIRLEDIHPNYDVKLLLQAVDILKRRNIPFAISLIPEFVAAGSPESSAVTLADKPEFIKAIRYAEKNGGEILIHGYTHHVAGLTDCAPMGSGADYEFWDRCRQKPLPYDSEAFAAERVSKAKALVVGAGLSSEGWVTPHYAASPVDFSVFGRDFDRTVQRVCYSFGWGPGETPIYVSQFFPYTIFKDHYGQFVWPENLGFIPMPGSNWGYATPDDIESSARLTWVVRDSWASFFWHPQLMKKPGEIEHLERIIDGIRARGYEFVSLKSLKSRGE